MAKTDYHPQPAPRGWDRRGVLILVGAAGLLAAVLAYAGPSWLVVADQILRDGAFLLVWLAAAAGWGALLISPVRESLGIDALSASAGHAHERDARVTNGEPLARASRPCESQESTNQSDRTTLLLHCVTAAASGLGLMSLAALGLGLAGWLNQTVAIGLIAGGLVAAALASIRVVTDEVRHPGRRGISILGGDFDRRARAWLAQPAGWDWLWLLVLPLLAIAIVGACVPPGILWSPDEPHGYDVVEYHLQVPREWFEAGKIVPLNHNVFSYFPFGVETHFLLAMHLRGGPWKGMYLAQLMHVAHVALSVLAVYGLASSLSQRRSTAVAAGLAMAAVPWLTLLAPVAYNEGGLLLYGALSVGWALRGIDAAPRAALARFALAGAMAGFACGVKLTGVPMLLAGVPLAVVSASPRRCKYAMAFVAVGALVFSPWALRNLAWAGNPVFPEAARLLGGAHFSPEQIGRWEQAHSPRPDQRPLVSRLRAFGREVVIDWRFGYAVPLAAGLLGAARSRRDPRARALAALMLLLIAFWIGLTHLQGRFFVLAVPIAALLIALTDWARMVPVVVGVLGAAALASTAGVHREFSARLSGANPLAGVLGVEDLSGLNPPGVAGVPSDATLVLIGEARAFWYPRPMRALRYRTVFDVDAAQGAAVIDAWKGSAPPTGAEYLLVDPEELRRFRRTYRGIPELPPEWKERTGPVFAPPGQ